MARFAKQCNIALARPYFPENIGSAARALAVMGFESLSVIAPNCDPLDDRAVTLSSHANEVVLQKTRVYSAMDEWASNCDLRIGFCLRERAIGPMTCTLPELPDILKNKSFSQLGLLFGCEKSGLDNNELSYCHYVCEIPTSNHLGYHSLNLSQAVQVVVYSLMTQMDKDDYTQHRSETPLNLPTPEASLSLDRYLARLVESPQMKSFTQRTTKEQTLRRLRSMAQQSITTQTDLNFFYGLLKGFVNV